MNAALLSSGTMDSEEKSTLAQVMPYPGEIETILPVYSLLKTMYNAKTMGAHG